jgi:predicted XRE-type DNA-binding protein
VFADLGLPNPEERLLKAQLMHAISTEIRRRQLTQDAACALVGLAQPDLSRIKNGRGSGFSTERLIDVLRYLGTDVEIVVRPTTKTMGELRFRELTG